MEISLAPSEPLGTRTIPGLDQAQTIGCAETRVVELKDCRVTGVFPVVISKANILFSDLLCVWQNTPYEHEIFKKFRLGAPRDLKGISLLLATSYGENYYHWLIEQLPRLHLAQLAGYDLRQFDNVICTLGTAPFVKQTLKFFPDFRGRLLPTTREEHWRCERLVAFNFPAEHGVPTRWAIDFMRAVMLDRIPAGEKRNRIYISREQARGRKITNEMEVLKLVESLGFKKVNLESMSFEAQLNLFAKAEAIIGPHGAGFANILFAPRDCRITEFMIPEYPAFCYAHLSRMIGQSYRYLVANTDHSGGETGLKDMHVPIEELRSVLEKLS